ncbi:MAG: sodium:proton antiporter [Saprospiraceae bacterium]|nr:sodium:proton antiporter [Saprospiraceae bacterium]MCB9324927.1 sodium:proton antiporter [Lewinellaceae bacterium]
MLELAGLVILGISAQWIAWRTKVPAILPLILIGLFFGPVSSLFEEGGAKWIEPVYDPAIGQGLFPGESLFYFVSLSIGIILFEGGLTLKLKEVKVVGPTIMRIITLGSLITFVGGAIGTHFLLELSWKICFLFSGLIIVTGPTVITPILRNLPLKKNVTTVLKWEGILIDPIGALVAVLVYDFIISGEEQMFTVHAIISFLRIVIVGISLGFTAAHLLNLMIQRNLIPHYLLNVFTLALVLGVFVASDQLEHESGLLSVVIMGMVLGNLDLPQLKNILDFKESLSVLLISILFILLAANFDIDDIYLLLEWKVLYLFLFIILVLRPLSIYSSSFRSTLNFSEKTFIAWVGPRGIVAAGVASLFGIKLTGKVPGAEYIAPLVFMVVSGTVLINATTARIVARWLGVVKEKAEGILIVGANKAARLIGAYLEKSGRSVVIIDRAANLVARAKAEGLNAIEEDIYSETLIDNFELLEIGEVLAMTGSTDVNLFAVKRFAKSLGEDKVHRLISQDELKGPKNLIPKDGLFSCVDDYLNLSEVVRDYPVIHEHPLSSKAQFEKIVNMINQKEYSIPLFLKKNKTGKLLILPSNCEKIDVEAGDLLVYVGKKIEEDISMK